MTIDVRLLPNEAGIYQILNTITGKSYIGSSIKIRNRVRAHLKALKRGNHYYKLQSAWDKHGASAFSVVVLELVTNTSELLKREHALIVEHGTMSNGYNIVEQHGKNRLGATNTEEHRQKLSKALTGTKHSQEEIEANRERSRLRWQDPQYRERMKLAAKERAARPDQKQRLLELAQRPKGSRGWSDEKRAEHSKLVKAGLNRKKE